MSFPNKITYPILILPNDLDEILKSIPEEALKPKEPVEPTLIIPKSPIEPSKPAGGIQSYGCLLLSIVIFVLAGVIGSNSEIMASIFDGFGLVFLVIIVLGFGMVYNYHKNGENAKKEYKNKMDDYKASRKQYQHDILYYREEYERKKTEYQTELIDYIIQLDKWEKGLLRSQRPDYISAMRKASLLYRTNPTAPTEISTNYNKGVSEEGFYNLLLSKSSNFSDKWVLSLSSAPYIRPYRPDIVYIEDIYSPLTENTTSLYVDIEIDEPYVGATGEPIHYIGSEKRRNSFFTENGWVVIRFAEEQVIKQPQECAEYVMNIIGNIKSGIYPAQNHAIHSVEKWSKEQCHKLAFARYRNTYLNFELSEKLQEELLFEAKNNSRLDNNDYELPF